MELEATELGLSNKTKSSYAFAMALGTDELGKDEQGQPAKRNLYYLLFLDGSKVKCARSTDLAASEVTFEAPTAGSLGPAICRDGGTYWVAYREESGSSSGRPILVGSTTDPSTAIAVSRPGPFPDASNTATGDDHNKDFPDTDKPPACCMYGSQPVFAFKRSQHELALIWNTDGTWHNLPPVEVQAGKSWPSSQHVNGLAIPNQDGYVSHSGNAHGDNWVITSRAPSCTSFTVGTELHFFLVLKQNGGGHIWFGHVKDPGDAKNWLGKPLSKVEVAIDGKSRKVETQVAPAVVEYNGDVLMVFSNENDEGNQKQFDSIKDKKKREKAQKEEKEKHENRLWLAFFDGSTQAWTTANRMVDDKGEMLPKPSKKQVSNMNLIVDHDGTNLLLSYSDGDRIRLYRLTPPPPPAT